MKAAILAIGSELLGTRRLDTNSLKLTAALERHGVELVGKSIVPDDEAAIADELLKWTSRASLVLVGGGLGPTADDVTRGAAARAFERAITLDEDIVAAIRERFRGYGREMPEVNRRQAEVVEGAEVIPNPCGSAPAQRLVHGDATVFLFPAVPFELEALIESCLEPWLAEHAGGATGSRALERRIFKIASRPESEVEETIAPLYERFGREGISVLASPGEIQIHLTVRGSDEERRSRLDAMSDALRRIAGELIFTADAESLEAVVGRLLIAAGITLTTAESCTGGLLAERLTNVAGSSAFFRGGIVAYANELKTQLLGVEAEVLAADGAVSEPVARRMAEGVRARYGSDWGVGITGVAGPGGGTDAKPVGTVHLAVAGPDVTEHRCVRFSGDRERVRRQASQLALELLRRHLT